MTANLGLHHRALGVAVIENADATAWNDYLTSRGDALLFHRAEWSGVFSTYGLRIWHLAAVRGGKITGVLPLVHQQSFLFGRQLVSLPWFDAVGVVADDEESRDALVRYAIALGEQLRVDAVQIRQQEGVSACDQLRTDKVLMRRRLAADSDELWMQFKPKVRNQVKKGMRSSLSLESGGTELVDAFFRVYAENMRDLGSPSHSRQFFEAVLRVFAQDGTIHIVRHHRRPVGAGLTLRNGDRLEIPWASSLRKFNSLCINHFMYWHLLADACRAGFSWFHFGRSTVGSGTWQFKKQWGADELPLYWHHWHVNPRSGGGPSRNPQPGRIGQAIWRHLPVSMTRRLGPRLISQIP